MLINVSTLLTEVVGSARRYHVEDEVAEVASDGYRRDVAGELRLIRTARGVLVMADLMLAEVEQECSRCLEPFRGPLRLEFDEEFVLPRDPLTGETATVGPDDFRIDEHRHLDLSEAVRQYEQSALPLQPICRPDCRGLCPTCGQNLNLGSCDCPHGAEDHRWSALESLAERLRTEDPHGTAEASDTGRQA